MLTPEQSSTLQLLRTRILGKEQIDRDELKQAILLMRADRQTAATRAKTTRAKSPKATKEPARPASELLGKLGIPGL